jgi:hypothetical protein
MLLQAGGVLSSTGICCAWIKKIPVRCRVGWCVVGGNPGIYGTSSGRCEENEKNRNKKFKKKS